MVYRFSDDLRQARVKSAMGNLPNMFEFEWVNRGRLMKDDKEA
jgi:hypothetical protein